MAIVHADRKKKQLLREEFEAHNFQNLKEKASKRLTDYVDNQQTNTPICFTLKCSQPLLVSDTSFAIPPPPDQLQIGIIYFLFIPSSSRFIRLGNQIWRKRQFLLCHSLFSRTINKDLCPTASDRIDRWENRFMSYMQIHWLNCFKYDN